MGNGLTHTDATQGCYIHQRDDESKSKNQAQSRGSVFSLSAKAGVSQQTPRWGLSITAEAARYGTEPAGISPSATKVWWRSKGEDQMLPPVSSL